jgi:amidase
MVPLELGSDIGGSIRTPAAFNGVMGHKPTIDLVTLDGLPLAEDEPLHPAVAGPMARSAEDLAGALNILARVPLLPTRFSSLKGVKLFVLTSHPYPGAAVMKDIAEAIDAAAKRAEEAGAIVVRESDLLPDLAKIHQEYFNLLMVSMSLVKPAKEATLGEWLPLVGTQNRARLQWAKFFNSFDAILAPVHGSVGFLHDDSPNQMTREIDIDGVKAPYMSQFVWAGIPVFGGLPATSVPIGKSKSTGGMPINLQVICGEMRDHDAIAIGGMLAIPNDIVVPKAK